MLLLLSTQINPTFWSKIFKDTLCQWSCEFRHIFKSCSFFYEITKVFCLYFGAVVVSFLNPNQCPPFFPSLHCSDFVKHIQKYRKPENILRALWRSDSLHPSSSLTIISPSPVVLIFVPWWFSGIPFFSSDVQSLWILRCPLCTYIIILGRPLNHCGGKHSRKVLEKSDLKDNSVQAAFILHTATSEAVNDPPWLWLWSMNQQKASEH